MPHGVPGDRELQFGDFITMDFGCIYSGYCSDMTRTVALGFVTEEMDKVYKTVLKAQLAGIAATKAGVTGRDIDGAARKVIADAGYGDVLRPRLRPQPRHSRSTKRPTANTSNDEPMPAGAVVLGGAGHLSARQIRRSHRGCDRSDEERLRGSHKEPEKFDYFVRTVLQNTELLVVKSTKLLHM